MSAIPMSSVRWLHHQQNAWTPCGALLRAGQTCVGRFRTARSRFCSKQPPSIMHKITTSVGAYFWRSVSDTDKTPPNPLLYMFGITFSSFVRWEQLMVIGGDFVRGEYVCCEGNIRDVFVRTPATTIARNFTTPRRSASPLDTKFIDIQTRPGSIY